MHNSIPEQWTETELKRNHKLYEGPDDCRAVKVGKEIFFVEDGDVTKHDEFDDGVVSHQRIHVWIWEHHRQSA